jgi:hypothetical protein
MRLVFSEIQTIRENSGGMEGEGDTNPIEIWSIG